MTCTHCHDGAMEPASVPSTAHGLRTIGYAAAIGAVVMAVAGTGWGLGAMQGGSGTHDWLSGLTRVVLVWVVSSPVLIIGLTLVCSKKTVWRCQHCGYMYDRA